MNAIEHLLACLAEEGSEVAQAACKAGRFGITDSHADRKFLPNNEYIVQEINDLLGVVELLQEFGAPLVGIGDREAVDAKKRRVLKFMEYSVQRGKLSMVVDDGLPVCGLTAPTAARRCQEERKNHVGTAR